MTTSTATPTEVAAQPERPPATSRDHPEQRVTAGGVLRSEWVKLRSLRSNTFVLAGAAAAMLVVGLIFSAIVGGVISSSGNGPGGPADPTDTALQGVMLAQLIIGVLGVLAITGEYSTGMIRSTFTMVPRRLPVLWAKIAVLTAVTFAAMLVTTFVAFFAGQALIGSGGAIATASIGDPDVLRTLIGTAGYLTGVALIGLAAGTLLRSTAGAISTLVAIVFLLPGLGAVLLPTSWQDNVLKYLPSNAGSAFTSVTPPHGMLSPTAGLLVFLAWIVVPLAAAAIAIKRRPA
jgi:ABC-2 type transport system permease protein